MDRLAGVWSKPRNRKLAALLAFTGALVPAPVAGVHKFYLGQPFWGAIYIGFSLVAPMFPNVASVFEGIWYLSQNPDEFDQNFNDGIASVTTAQPLPQPVDLTQVNAVAEAMRQLDQLRADGLISEYEFEQKRRQFLDRLS